jgi:hypothetical protein
MQPMMTDTMKDFATQGRHMTEETTKFIQKNFDESQKLMNGQAKKGMDMLKKACDAATTTDQKDFFATTQNMWQDTLNTVRTSMEEITKTNVQKMENWSCFMTSACTANGETASKKPAGK